MSEKTRRKKEGHDPYSDEAVREKDPAHEEKGAKNPAVKNPAEAYTKQNQPADAGPLSKERDVGQFSGRGRPPLQKK